MVINPFVTFQSRSQQQQKQYLVVGPQRRGTKANNHTTTNNNNNLGKIISMTILFTSTLGGIIMVFNLLFSRQTGGASISSSSIAMSSSSSPSSSIVVSPSEIENRLKGALFAFLSGDALAAPTHWYYGGFRQIQNDYGTRGIEDYTKPKFELSGSILNKSNLNGGGRSASVSPFSSSYNTNRDKKTKTIIGDIINHGKEHLWDPSKQIHYHATLHKGEPTLEVQIARVLMKSIVATNGVFDADHFRQSYITFMTTPGSHNDTYASTCHRMFFANLYFRQLNPKDCPDNDQHNVDAIDGLVLPTIVALATTARKAVSSSTSSTISKITIGDDSESDQSLTNLLNDVAQSSASCAAVTRKSNVLEYVSGQWGQLVAASILSPTTTTPDGDEASLSLFGRTLNTVSEQLIQRRPNPQRASRLDQLMTACYLTQSLPPLFDMIAKYVPNNNTSKDGIRHDDKADWVWDALIDNANVGGENVHRGSVFGSILGARAGVKNLPRQMIEGLYQNQELKNEINDFVHAVMTQTK